jgi:co-chaperonin GroES (HSP10)
MGKKYKKKDKLCIPLNSCVFIYREKNTKDEVEIGDTKLYIDTSWYEYDHVIQSGIVRYVPERLHPSFKTKMELLPGDIAYCHHFVANDDNMIDIYDEKLSLLNYNMFYARVRDGKVHMLSDWVMVEKVQDKDEDLTTESGIIIKIEKKKIEQIGIIKYVNSKSKEQGFKIGDKVMFMQDADYEMEFEGDMMYRMRNQDILIRIDGDAVPMAVDHKYEETPDASQELGSFEQFNSMYNG